MLDEKRHYLEVDQELDGAVLWYCPECGRRIIMGYDPFINTVLTEGDPEILHVGIADVDINIPIEGIVESAAIDHERLEIFEEFFDNHET